MRIKPLHYAINNFKRKLPLIFLGIVKVNVSGSEGSGGRAPHTGCDAQVSE